MGSSCPSCNQPVTTELVGERGSLICGCGAVLRYTVHPSGPAVTVFSPETGGWVLGQPWATTADYRQTSSSSTFAASWTGPWDIHPLAAVTGVLFFAGFAAFAFLGSDWFKLCLWLLWIGLSIAMLRKLPRKRPSTHVHVEQGSLQVSTRYVPYEYKREAKRELRLGEIAHFVIVDVSTRQHPHWILRASTRCGHTFVLSNPKRPPLEFIMQQLTALLPGTHDERTRIVPGPITVEPWQ